MKHLLPLAIALLLTPATARAQDEVVYYHTDAIGSVRMITDASGAVIGRYDYLPFGELWPAGPPGLTDARQFAGKERDTETGLDYFGARYFRAQSGRFTSVDPVMNIEAALGDPQQWNRYGYARNNPFVFVDPDGREIWLSAAHQRAVGEAGRRAAPAAAVGVGVAAVVALIEGGPVVWRAAVTCYVSVLCQSRTLEITEGLIVPGATPTTFSASAAARNFGLVGDMADAGSLFGGQLANGASVAVNFSKVGETLGVNISMVNGPSGTLALLEQGAVKAARAAGASTLNISATAANAAMARFLRLSGFVEQEGVWIKQIELR